MSAVLYPGATRAGVNARRTARVARRSRSISLLGVASFSGGVCVLSIFFTQMFNMMGIVQVERYQVAARAAEVRASAAERGALAVRLEVEQLQRSDSIERWASVNGLAPSYAVSNEKTASD